MVIVAEEVDLTGVVDLHIHTAPDVVPRSVDDLTMVQQAREAGMRGVFIKSHMVPTADRAYLAERAIGGIRVFGGLVLNRSVGGLNPFAVEVALKQGAKIIWLPTKSSLSNSPEAEGRPGLAVVDETGAPLPVVAEIIELLKPTDAYLATGHIVPREVLAIARAARAQGLSRLIITHPDASESRVPLAMQQELVALGAVLERCFVSTHKAEGTPIDGVAAQIRATGLAHNYLSTDYGQGHNPPPVVGFRRWLAELANRGFSAAELRQLACQTPARIAGLE